MPARSPLCRAVRLIDPGFQNIKGGQEGRTLLLLCAIMGKERPSHIPPELWKEYLRRYPRWAWWVGHVGGNHPDYPGLPSQRDTPTSSRPASPPSSSTSSQPTPPPSSVSSQSEPSSSSVSPRTESPSSSTFRQPGSIPPPTLPTSNRCSPLWASLALLSPSMISPPPELPPRGNLPSTTQSAGIPSQGIPIICMIF